MAIIFDRIYVQFGTLKQKFRPWRTIDDFGFIEGSPNEPLHLDDFGVDPDDDGLIVGLTVERLRREVKFGIPGSAVAMREGMPLDEDDLVFPGNVIEFVRHRALGARRRGKRSKNTKTTEHYRNDNKVPAEAAQDFVFAFDAVRRQWHVRFRYGETADEVEEDWLQESPSIRFIAYLLERPKAQVLCTTMFPSLPAESISRSAVSDVQVTFADDRHANHESAAQKAAKQSRDEWKQQMSEVAAEIKEARESGEEENAVALEATFALLEQQYNREFDIHGRVRTGVSTADQLAANRIRNGIGRLLEKCIDGSKKKKYALNRFAEYLEKHIDYNSGHACYDDSQHWHVVYPPDFS